MRLCRSCRLEELSDSLSGLRQRAKAAEDERDRLEGPKEVRAMCQFKRSHNLHPALTLASHIITLQVRELGAGPCRADLHNFSCPC